MPCCHCPQYKIASRTPQPKVRHLYKRLCHVLVNSSLIDLVEQHFALNLAVLMGAP